MVTNTVTLFTADHFAITATAYNAAAEKGSEPFLRPAPCSAWPSSPRSLQNPDWLDAQQ